MKDDLKELVEKAKNGSASAIEGLVIALQKSVYNLALKFFWNPQIAEEATQEVFIRVFTSLSTFKFESRFSTWVHRIATNHFINLSKQNPSPIRITFEDFENNLSLGLEENHEIKSYPTQIEKVLVFEAKAGCSLGMLQCLDREHRLAYVVGEILEFSTEEAAYILDISEDNFRQRLHRSKEKIKRFMNKNCGLVSKTAPCKCQKQVVPAVKSKKIDPSNLLFSDFSSSEKIQQDISRLLSEVEVFNLTNEKSKPLKIAEKVRLALSGK